MTSESELREQNLGAVYDVVFDADGDGFVSRSDLTAVGQRISDEFGLPDGPQRAAIDAAYRSLWEGLRADFDGDGDGRISRAEFAAAFLSGHDQPQVYYEQLIDPLIEVLADTIDQDGDGFIEAAEYLRVCTAQGLAGRYVLAGFQRLDTDGDGKIRTGELRAGVAHLFLSQDPADPGTGLFGHA